MIIDRFRTRVGKDDWGGRQGEELIEDFVGTVGLVDDQPEPIALGDELFAQGTKPVPLLAGGIGGGVAEVVVQKVHRADHAHAEVKKSLQQGEIAADRVGVLHGEIDDAFARSRDRSGFVSLGREDEMIRIGGYHFVDSQRDLDRGVPGRRVTRRSARTLGRIDHPKATIESAFDHAGNIDLAEILPHIVALEDIPARAPQIGRRIEVGIEREQTLMNHAGGLGPEGRDHGMSK